ncbi:replication initiator protein A [Enterococcus hirae]|uniref:replication initiator protein A n=2 Tax=Enterococcus TaxID=1350 RepID=UPI0009C05B6C|nr:MULTISPECIES: replication initiator protein A [Enterococcus]MDP8584165.1 replication initiator protein A [Listeria innocua]EGP5143523.1 replication initiator protein A [Enterococcus faecium]EME8216144.1 replication initiator protein A [Enterococcus faecium]EMF0071067.1 replication initiator protein A [Enterococcus hirae]EMF0167743.1 replication initiator protein A [Enterococcus hirae]
MQEFNFITAQETYRALYYQLPKVLFTSPLYKDMSNDSKIAYAMLQDRCEASIENNWIDEQNRIFFIFTRAELMDILGCKENKISKIKKELKSKNLLFEKRTPPKKLPNGEWLNLPNRLYLGKLEVTAEDVFVHTNTKNKVKELNPESGKNPPSNKHLELKDSSGRGKNPPSNKKALNQLSFESGKKGDNLFYSSSLDTNRHLIDTEADQLQNKILLGNFVDIMKEDSVNTFVPEKVLNLIKTFSNTFKEAQQTVQTIHNAKKKAEELEKTIVVYEELESYGIDAEKGLYMTLLKAYQKQKIEKVKNLQNLIFVYVKNWFIEKAIAAKLANEQREKFNELPTVSTENWLE